MLGREMREHINQASFSVMDDLAHICPCRDGPELWIWPSVWTLRVDRPSDTFQSSFSVLWDSRS